MTGQEVATFLMGKAKVYLKQKGADPRELLSMVDEQAADNLPKNPHSMQLIHSLMEATELGTVGPQGLHDWIEGMTQEQKDDLTLEAVAEVLNRYSSLE